MEKFDGFLFGNGLSLNLLNQLSGFIAPDKQYLLSVDEFLKKWITNDISPKERNRIFKLFYKKITLENEKYMRSMQDDYRKYYSTRNSNIEYYLGVDLFSKETCGYDYDAIMSLFPFLYNIWHDILADYILYLKFDKKISSFNSSIQSYLYENSRLWTTNFDTLFDLLNPDHIHGKFIRNIKTPTDLVLFNDNPEKFNYRCIWGWNGFGKLNYINDNKDLSYFDFDFFYDNSFHIDNMLIYGISFQVSGYMKQLAEYKDGYKNPTEGGIVDEHILTRLRGLQNNGNFNRIVFAYFTDEDKKHYEAISNLYALENVDFLSTTELNFHI